MAIVTSIANSAKQELLSGVHNFSSGGDSFKVALYDNASATIGASTTAYTATGEVSGAGYTATGQALTGQSVSLDSSTAIVDFANTTWSSSTITASGYGIYNDTATGDPWILAEQFTETSSVSGDFTITWPTAAAATAIFRIA